jgi:hypothetical protein
MTSQNSKNQPAPKQRPKDTKPDKPSVKPDDAWPLAEQIEDEMLDQDIPFETGSHPDGK